MLSKSHPIILFIDRFGFSVYQDTLANIPKFNFTPDLVVNLDVIDKDQLLSFIATFIQINKITPSSVAIILSDYVIFVKDLASSVQKPAPAQGLKEDLTKINDHKEEVQSFLEDIPFEDVLAKVIKVRNIDRIVAVNKDLVMTIADAFVNNKSVVEAVIPSFIFGQNAIFTAGLTLDNVKVALGDAEAFKLGNLLTDQERILPTQKLEIGTKNLIIGNSSDLASSSMRKTKNLRKYLLIGGFVILLIVLTIIVINLAFLPASKSNKQKVSNKAAVLKVAATPTLTVASESATTVPIGVKKINMKISHDASSQEVAVKLRVSLSAIGFQNIVDEISKVSIPEKSSIIFSQDISTDLRNNIVEEIDKILPDIDILEGQDIENTINISIGKS